MATPQERTEAAKRLVDSIHRYLTTPPGPRREPDGLPANEAELEQIMENVCEALVDCANADANLADLRTAITWHPQQRVPAGGGH